MCVSSEWLFILKDKFIVLKQKHVHWCTDFVKSPTVCSIFLYLRRGQISILSMA